MWANRVAHPLLVPRGLVHAVVMAAARRHGGFVKVAVEEQRPGGTLPASRVTVDARAAGVVITVRRRGRLVPEDAIREAGIFEVVPADIVKRFGTIGGAHAVNLHDDK